MPEALCMHFLITSTRIHIFICLFIIVFILNIIIVISRLPNACETIAAAEFLEECILITEVYVWCFITDM